MLIRIFCVLSTSLLLTLACSSSSDNGGTGGKKGTGGTKGDGGGTGGTGAVDGGGTGGTDAGGGTGGGAGAAGATSCGDFGTTQTCKDCLTKNCCSQGKACAAQADCSAFITCARQCPNPTDTTSACIQTCATQHGTALGQYNDLLICMDNSCASSCTYL